MNKFDNTEFNPRKIPLPSNDFFSFLDNEIYYIGALQNSECDRFLKAEAEALTYDPSQKTKFLFRWKGTGYVICCADDPSLVLTLREAETAGSFLVSVESYQNRTEQIWDVLPFINLDNQPSGICIRSAVKHADNYFYIGWENGTVSATAGMYGHTSLILQPLSDWITFGMAAMQYLEWGYYTESNTGRAFKNYFANIGTNISVENALMFNNTGLIVNQSGGNFSQLQYADVYMDETACEVIATCNAIRLVTGDFDETNQDFFKLALEFELSGLYKNSFKKFIVDTGTALGIKTFSAINTKEGGWGADPDRIGDCLAAHNIKFQKIHISEQSASTKPKKAEEAVSKANVLLESSKCAIVSYNFSKLHQAIHTFACVRDSKKMRTFNRHSNHTPDGNYFNFSLPDIQRGIYTNLSEIFKNDSEGRFYVGYFLED